MRFTAASVTYVFGCCNIPCNCKRKEEEEEKWQTLKFYFIMENNNTPLCQQRHNSGLNQQKQKQFVFILNDLRLHLSLYRNFVCLYVMFFSLQYFFYSDDVHTQARHLHMHFFFLFPNVISQLDIC